MKQDINDLYTWYCDAFEVMYQVFNENIILKFKETIDNTYKKGNFQGLKAGVADTKDMMKDGTIEQTRIIDRLMREKGHKGILNTKRNISSYLKSGISSHDEFRDLSNLLEQALTEELPKSIIDQVNELLLKYEQSCPPEV